LDIIYISLLVIFAAFGAFCFNAGHRRAYRAVLKDLLKGQLALGWYKYFARVGDDKATKELKLALESYLTTLEKTALERNLELGI
jgi:hypothetical protein